MTISGQSVHRRHLVSRGVMYCDSFFGAPVIAAPYARPPITEISHLGDVERRCKASK